MTSVDGITQLGNESEASREKSDPQLKKNHPQKKTVILKNSSLNDFKTDTSVL